MDRSYLRAAAILSVILMFITVLISYALNKNADVIHAYDASGGNAIGIEDYDIVNQINSFNTVNKDKLIDYNQYIKISNSIETTDILAPPIINQLYEESITADIYEDSECVGEDSAETRLMKSMPDINMDIVRTMGEKYLVIRKPEGSLQSYQIKDLYITSSLSINLSGDFTSEMDKAMVGRMYNGKLYIGDPVYSEVISYETDDTDDSIQVVTTRDYGDDPVHGISLLNKYDTINRSQDIQIVLELDDVYVHEVFEDTGYYYIGLKDPTEVYDRILVIDAGHGGKDAGALSKDKKTYEKDINLNILLALKNLLDKEDIKVYYTRLTDEKLYLRPRVNLANAVDSDLFISIHCNASEVTSPNGTEVYYYDKESKSVSSKDLAGIISKELHKETNLKQLGLVEKSGKNIFILRKANVPAVLIETAFMTSNKDIDYLRKDKNIQDIAKGIYNGIMRAYDELLP